MKWVVEACRYLEKCFNQRKQQVQRFRDLKYYAWPAHGTLRVSSALQAMVETLYYILSVMVSDWRIWVDDMIWCIFKGSHWLLEVGPWKRASIEGGKQVRSKYSGIRESGKLELEWEVMQVVKIGQILNIFLNIWANVMCSWIGCGVWEKGIKDDGFPPAPLPTSPHTWATKWRMPRPSTEMEED